MWTMGTGMNVPSNRQFPWRSTVSSSAAAFLAVGAESGLAPIDARPAPPAPARLPAGLPLNPERLAGTWAGSFELYPALRTGMVLHRAHATTGWSGRLELKYHSADAADQSLDLGDLHVSERGISFENPAAWQGLVMRFRGVSPRAGLLQGTVEAARADAANPMRLLGSWELRRQ
jgi:hypothetical protein